jgi:hypothetical protein
MTREEPMPQLSRREALIAFGTVGFGAAYGVRELVIPSLAESASTCLLHAR